MGKIIDFIKNETVLCVALLLAIASAFVIAPDMEYIDYIDFRTLTILFCLMAVMAGLQNVGLFKRIAEKLLTGVSNYKQLIIILVVLCFVFGMIITNDVALITFVPFTFIVLRMLGKEYLDRLAVPVVILQTIAANLGSMLTPIGNPQNLYLYNKSGMGLGSFLMLMLPYSLLALAMVVICCFIVGKREKNDLVISFAEKTTLDKKGIIIYVVLFLICLLTVANVLPYYVMLVLVTAAIVIYDRKILLKVDYSLLLTFVGFFIFIGNMGRVPFFKALLEKVVVGNELIVSILSSQVISNVPAALLLSGFSDNYRALIVGVNLGGLGTLIASMASLISYKILVREDGKVKGKYLKYFSLLSIIFLVALIAEYIVLQMVL